MLWFQNILGHQFIDLVKMIVSRKCKITAIDPINTICY